METEATQQRSRDEVADSLLRAWRVNHGEEFPDEVQRALVPLLDLMFSSGPGLIWSVLCTFNGDTSWTLAGFSDNSMRVQRIEDSPPNAFVVHDVPYEPIRYSERSNFATTPPQVEIRIDVPAFGEILVGPVPIDDLGRRIGRGFRERAKA
jgi:hypothetical protein